MQRIISLQRFANCAVDAGGGMGWEIGYDSNWKRDIGYGIPALCDYPGCNKLIDRGLSYVCGGELYGGEHGCGLYFCVDHLLMGEEAQQCQRCVNGKSPYKAKRDVAEWTRFKETDSSWAEWRAARLMREAG